MATKKVYSVVFYDGAADQLGMLIALWVKKNEMGTYVYAKAINPNGPYFHMWIEWNDATGETREMELQVPHSFIKAVVYAADVTHIGFIH